MTDLIEDLDIEEEEHEAGAVEGQEDGLDIYIRQIRKYPLLKIEEEYECVTRWQQSKDSFALNKLVNSHLRLAAGIASGYTGYGLPFADLLSEGSIGILKAVDKFDVEKGFRFSTYASWWIHAAIKEYVLRMWSTVRLGSNATQKKLFFKLRSLKSQLRNIDENELPDDYIAQIANELDVPHKDVMDMNLRLAGKDFSLNVMIGEGEYGGEEWMDTLEDDTDDQETVCINNDTQSKQSKLLHHALESLSEREHLIFKRRHLSETPATLAEMSGELGISRERIRQIEAKAMQKVQRAVKSKAIEQRITTSF